MRPCHLRILDATLCGILAAPAVALTDHKYHTKRRGFVLRAFMEVRTVPEITVGKWKMRNGEMAVVLAVGNPLGTAGNYPVLGWTRHGFCTWTKEGLNVSDREGRFDLHSPWPADPPAPLKLEVGRKYERASGEVLSVIAYVPVNPSTGIENARPFFAIDRLYTACWFTEQGCKFCDKADAADLIREHVPTPTPPTPLEVCKEFRRLWSNPIETYVHPDVRKLIEIADAAIAAEEAKGK